MYCSRSTSAILQVEPYYNVTASLQKSFLNNSLILSLEGNDFFEGSRMRLSMQVRGVQFVFNDLQDTRRVVFRLKWYFNNYKEQKVPTSTLEQDLGRL
jgi:hypothetical protein